jgi:hypothetical protein
VNQVSHSPQPHHDSALAIDPVPTLTLWNHLFEGVRGYLGLFTGKRDAATGRLTEPHEKYLAYPAVATYAVDWLAAEAADGREVYFCPHLLKGKRRVKENAELVHCLWVDGDGALVPAHLPQPTAVVESSPGRHHYYWRLSRPIDPTAAEELNKRLAYGMGADKSGWDLTQLLRPPGFPNGKYPGAPAVELVRAS